MRFVRVIPTSVVIIVISATASSSPPPLPQGFFGGVFEEKPLLKLGSLPPELPPYGSFGSSGPHLKQL
eukprot:3576506-Amphidinium_carterae.1